MKNYKFVLLVAVAIIVFAVADNSLVYAQFSNNLSDLSQASVSVPNFQPQQVLAATQSAGRMPPIPELQPNATSTVEPDGMLVILIGINDYTESTIDDLSGAEDVRLALTDWLIPYSKTKNRVTVWVASDKMDDLAQKHSNLIQKCMLPTKASILQLLKEAVQDNSYKRLVVFFCGHGVRINDTSYLVPQDATKKNISSFVSLKDDVFAPLNMSKIKNKLLVLDACRKNVNLPNAESSTKTRSFDTTQFNKNDDFMSEFEAMSKKDSNGYNFNVITSCSKGEQANELQTGNGLFMWYFIKGLAGEADMVAHYDGKIHLVEAYNYARAKTHKQSLIPVYPSVQTPELFCNTKTQFIISSSGKESNWVKESENETPWHFLYRTAVTLAKQDDPVPQQNAYGNLALTLSSPSSKATRILSGMIEINPSELSCYSIRSGIYRKKGYYYRALSDIRKTNGTLDVYSKETYDYQYQFSYGCNLYSSTSSPKVVKTIDKGLPISLDSYENGFYRIVAIDGNQVKENYWIKESNITWNPDLADKTITGKEGTSLSTVQDFTQSTGTSITGTTTNPDTATPQ